MTRGVWFSTKASRHLPSSGQCYLDQEQARGEPSRSSSMMWMAGSRLVPSEAAVAHGRLRNAASSWPCGMGESWLQQWHYRTWYQFRKGTCGGFKYHKALTSLEGFDRSTDFSLQIPGHAANGKDESYWPPTQHIKYVQPETESSFLLSIHPSSWQGQSNVTVCFIRQN